MNPRISFLVLGNVVKSASIGFIIMALTAVDPQGWILTLDH